MPNVSVLSATPESGALATAAVLHALNVGRVDPSTDVNHVSNPDAMQINRVVVQNQWPQPAPAGSGEVSEVTRHGMKYRFRTVGPADLELHRGQIRDLCGEINMLVVHAKFFLLFAFPMLLARALYLQQRLCYSATRALMEAIEQFYGEKAVADLATNRPKLYALIAGLGDAEWSIDPTKSAPAERYPLIGIGEGDAQSLYRLLGDFVAAKCREVEFQQKLVAEVVAESPAPLVVMCAGDEELAFTPGATVDWLKLVHATLAPRAGVTIIAEPLVDLRLANDGESTALVEGFNDAAGAAIWAALVNQPAPPVARRPTRRVAKIHAVALPVVAGVLALSGGFSTAVSVLGAATAIAWQGAAMYFAARGRSSLTSAPAMPAGPQPVAPPANPAPAPAADATPPAIKKRMQPSTNGKRPATRSR